MIRRVLRTRPRIEVLAVALALACSGCVPLRLTTYSYAEESVSVMAGRRVSLELKPKQPASLLPPPPNYLILVAVESDSLAHLAPRLLSVQLRGGLDSSMTVISAPARSGVDPTGRILSLMHLSVPLSYQPYSVQTSLEWLVDGRADTLTLSWTQKPTPKRQWFYWPWQMFTDG